MDKISEGQRTSRQDVAVRSSLPDEEASGGQTESLQSSGPLERRPMAATSRAASWLHHLAQGVAGEDPLKGGLDIDQPYQRGDVWTEDQRRMFIKSLLLGIPVPAIIVNDRFGAKYRDPLGRADWRYAVIDGKQRTITLLRWFGGDLAVPASWFHKEHVAETVDTADGPYVTFTGLTDVGQRCCNNDFIIPIAEGQFPTMEDEAHIFTLVNRAGTPMSDADLRRAVEIAAGQEGTSAGA